MRVGPLLLTMFFFYNRDMNTISHFAASILPSVSHVLGEENEYNLKPVVKPPMYDLKSFSFFDSIH